MNITSNGTFKLQFASMRSLEACFDWIPTGDLYGLDHAELLRAISDLPLQSESSKNECQKDDVWVKAMYFKKSDSRSAFVAFFLDSMYFPLDHLLRLPPFTTLHFAHVVAHEVGHHLVATRGFIFSPDESYKTGVYEEEMANRYAFNVVERMKSKWYYRLADKTLKFYSKVHFEDGRKMWKCQNIAAAADSWHKAWLLDPNNNKAGELYWAAKEGAGQPTERKPQVS